MSLNHQLPWKPHLTGECTYSKVYCGAELFTVGHMQISFHGDQCPRPSPKSPGGHPRPVQPRLTGAALAQASLCSFLRAQTGEVAMVTAQQWHSWISLAVCAVQSAAEEVCREGLPRDSFSQGGESHADSAVVELSKAIIDDYPAADPRWAESSSLRGEEEFVQGWELPRLLPSCNASCTTPKGVPANGLSSFSISFKINSLCTSAFWSSSVRWGWGHVCKAAMPHQTPSGSMGRSWPLLWL